MKERGKIPSLSGRQENAFGGKQMCLVQKKESCSFPRTRDSGNRETTAEEVRNARVCGLKPAGNNTEQRRKGKGQASSSVPTGKRTDWREKINVKIIANDGRKSNGCYCSTTRLWRTSSWRNIGVHPGKNGGCSKATLNSQNRLSGCMDTSSKTLMPKSWEYIEDLVVSLERNLYGHPLAGLLWERQIEKALMELGWKKVPNWECVPVHKKSYSYRSMWMTSKWAERSRLWLLCGRNWRRTLILRSQHHLLITFI